LTITDPDILEAVMEARESVEEESDLGRLTKLRTQVSRQEDRCIADLKTAFAAGDMERASEGTTALRYLARIQEAITEKM